MNFHKGFEDMAKATLKDGISQLWGGFSPEQEAIFHEVILLGAKLLHLPKRKVKAKAKHAVFGAGKRGWTSSAPAYSR